MGGSEEQVGEGPDRVRVERHIGLRRSSGRDVVDHLDQLCRHVGICRSVSFRRFLAARAASDVGLGRSGGEWRALGH